MEKECGETLKEGICRSSLGRTELGERLRIARLVIDFPESHRLSGGLLPNIYYLSKCELEQGHETAIFTYGRGQFSQEHLDDIPVYRVPKPRASRIFLGRSLLSAVRKTGFRPDVIHSVNATPLGWLFNREAAKGLYAKVVLSVHTPVLRHDKFRPEKTYLLNAEYFFLLRRLCRMVDLNVAVSRFVKKELVALGVASDRVTIIPSGLNYSLFSEAPRRRTEQAFFRCLYVGRFARIKSLDVLLGAALYLKQLSVPVKFTLIGGTPRDDDWKKVNSLISEFGLREMVETKQPVPHSELVQYYRSHDCFILPSSREPLGKVVLEAMASCTPVIASDSGGIPDLVSNGVNGILFKSQNSAALAHTIMDLMNRPKDAGKMALRGKLYAANFDWKEISRRYVEAFEQVASG